MSGRVERHRNFLEEVLSGSGPVIEKAVNSQLVILIELFHNISHLRFTQKEKTILSRHLSAIRSISRIRSATLARKALLALAPIILHTLIKAALIL